MKKLLIAAVAAGIVCTGSVSFGSTPQPVGEQSATTEIKQSIEKMQQSFSGLVKKTDNGLILETKEGHYQLKGLSLEEIVGKEVYVTGVVKNGEKENTLYVVKADVKE